MYIKELLQVQQNIPSILRTRSKSQGHPQSNKENMASSFIGSKTGAKDSKNVLHQIPGVQSSENEKAKPKEIGVT